MRCGRILVVSVVAASLAVPTMVEARPRVFGVFGAFFGGLTGHYHRYRHHHRVEVAHHRREETARRSAQTNFEGISGDTFGYVFWPTQYDTKFWAHGERDLVAAIFAADTASAPICGEPAQERANALADQIRQAIHASGDPLAALDVLQSKFVGAFDTLAATCPKVAPLTADERLKVLRDRLIALRDAGLSTRKALASFYDTLSDEQRTRFDPATTPAKVSGPGVPSARDARLCTAESQAPEAWPAPAIEQRVRPNEQQKASLEALQKALSDAGSSLNAACPKEVAPNPGARLEAAVQRIEALLDATNIVSPKLEDFYGQLSDEQKAAFNSI
jgi:hypothetical protein